MSDFEEKMAERRLFQNRIMKEYLGYNSNYKTKELLRLARRYHHIQEGWCSTEYSEAMTHSLEREEKRIEKRVTDIFKPYLTNGKILKIEFGGDPRGYEIKLYLANMRSNNMGGEDWGIPNA